MRWTESSVVDQRARFILEYELDEQTMTELCEIDGTGGRAAITGGGGKSREGWKRCKEKDGRRGVIGMRRGSRRRKRC